jgi:hypothetical protein
MLVFFKTNDEEMGTAHGAAVTRDAQEALDWLKREPTNAVILGMDPGDPCQGVAVFCGAAYDVGNYWVQALPLEEPDADGGDWTAEQAMLVAAGMAVGLGLS